MIDQIDQKIGTEVHSIDMQGTIRAFFDFSILLSGLIAFFDISLGPVVFQVDRIAQSNGHMMHFPSSCLLLFLHFAISKLLSFWQASS